MRLWILRLQEGMPAPMALPKLPFAYMMEKDNSALQHTGKPGKGYTDLHQRTTGITNEMVQNAPPFEDVAADIYHLLNGKIFVAHNVNFDFSFIRYHLAAAGYELQCNKLCTVRLGRKILPGLPSYSLGKLCRHLGIENESRHRAAGDAEATATCFRCCCKATQENHICAGFKTTFKGAGIACKFAQRGYRTVAIYAGGILFSR